MFRYSTSSANSSNRRSSTKPRSKPSDLSGQGSRRDDGIAPRRTRHGTEGVLRALRFLVLDAREHSGSEGAGARRHRYGEGDVKSPPPLQGASGSAQFGCFSFGGGESFHCACDELADITLPEAFELLVGVDGVCVGEAVSVGGRAECKARSLSDLPSGSLEEKAETVRSSDFLKRFGSAQRANVRTLHD